MNEHPLEKLRRLLGEQWSPQWVANEAIERACAEIERLRAHRAEQVPSIPLTDIQSQIDHIKKNGMDVARFGGEMADEGRCRELCAMYLGEFIQNYHMGKRLEELELRTGPHSGEGQT